MGGPGSGFTLIELLVVIALLGVLAALVGGGLQQRLRSDPLTTAYASLNQVERGLRLQAWRDGRPLTVAWTADGLVVRQPQGDTACWPRPAGLDCRLEPSGSTMAVWTYDAHGRSPDLRLEVGDERTRRRCRILGLSGQVVEDQ